MQSLFVSNTKRLVDDHRLQSCESILQKVLQLHFSRFWNVRCHLLYLISFSKDSIIAMRASLLTFNKNHSSAQIIYQSKTKSQAMTIKHWYQSSYQMLKEVKQFLWIFNNYNHALRFEILMWIWFESEKIISRNSFTHCTICCSIVVEEWCCSTWSNDIEIQEMTWFFDKSK